MSQQNGKVQGLGTLLRSRRQVETSIKIGTDLHVMVRPVALDELLLAGRIPDFLTPIALESVWAQHDVQKLSASLEKTKHYIELVDLVVKLALVHPKVADDPQGDDEIALDDLDLYERQRIFNLVTAGAEALRTFRQRQAADVALVPDGEKLLRPT